MRASDDWVEYALGFPSEASPGNRFDYSNTASFLLSAAIGASTGLSALEYGNENLFGPLGIEDVVWPSNPEGISMGWGELRMQPADLAKIGLLYLHHGVWDGTRIIPSAWVGESTGRQIQANTLREYYGYQWWIHPSGTFMALGYAGQYLVIAPELDLVVVFTSTLDEEEFFLPWSLYETYIVPAVSESSRPIDAAAADFNRLSSLVSLLAGGPPATIPEHDVEGPTRENAELLSGRRITLEENPFGLSGMTIEFFGSAYVAEHYLERTVNYSMGTDGRFALTEDGSLEPVAIRSTWTDESTFVLEYYSVGGAWRTELAITIDGNQDRVTVRTGRNGDTAFGGTIDPRS